MSGKVSGLECGNLLLMTYDMNVIDVNQMFWVNVADKLAYNVYNNVRNDVWNVISNNAFNDVKKDVLKVARNIIIDEIRDSNGL